MLTDYTSYDSIRAVLGVSTEEIEDAVIALPIYEVMLSEDLLDISDDIQSDYIVAVEVASPSAVEARFVKLMQTYASYQVAYTLLGSVPMFAPQNIADSSASVGRVTDPFKTLKNDVTQALEYLRIRLKAAYAAYNVAYTATAATTRTLVVSTGLAIDPVAGA